MSRTGLSTEKRRLTERQLSIVGNSSSLKMQVSEGITHVVLNSLGDHVVRASPAHIAIAHASIDHCNLPHHGRPFGSLGHGSKVVSHLGEILSRARHHLCGSRREAKGRKRSDNNQVLHRSLPCLKRAGYRNVCQLTTVRRGVRI
jgi:hypothetical protein